ncbi:hypothetical protein Trydic_g12155 [Trypoxylus dichotomus]
MMRGTTNLVGTAKRTRKDGFTVNSNANGGQRVGQNEDSGIPRRTEIETGVDYMRVEGEVRVGHLFAVKFQCYTAKMQPNIEQRYAIKFCVELRKAGAPATAGSVNNGTHDPDTHPHHRG